jgi:capsular polysaccharide transport system ATP-binding protein
MILLRDVSKSYAVRNGRKCVLDRINMELYRGQRVGILGGNGAGKSTLIRLLSGAESPTSGSIIRRMKVSWPLAFTGGFQGSLTGIDNLRFICRVYGRDFKEALPFVEDFTELGRDLWEPLRVYSSGMRARLAFSISMAIDFDCFLIDEVIAVGDSRFHEKCRFELFEKRRDRSLILVSHEANYIRKHCDRVAVLDAGKLMFFDSMDEGFDFHDRVMFGS